jgi:hypothetical protein
VKLARQDLGWKIPYVRNLLAKKVFLEATFTGAASSITFNSELCRSLDSLGLKDSPGSGAREMPERGKWVVTPAVLTLITSTKSTNSPSSKCIAWPSLRADSIYFGALGENFKWDIFFFKKKIIKINLKNRMVKLNLSKERQISVWIFSKTE